MSARRSQEPNRRRMPRTLFDVLRNWLWLLAIGWSFWIRVLGPKRGPKIMLGGMALSAIAITLYEVGH